MAAAGSETMETKDKGEPADRTPRDGCEEHSRQNKTLPLIDDFGFDATEKTILDIIRHLSGGLATPAYDGLERALACANAQWVEEASDQIVRSVAFLLSRVQCTRTRPFEFIVTDCPCCRKHICQSELQLMLLLRAGRQKDFNRLAVAAQLVAGSGEPSELIVAAGRVAAMLTKFGSFARTTQRTLH